MFAKLERHEGSLKITFECVLLGFSQNFGQSLLRTTIVVHDKCSVIARNNNNVDMG